MAQSLTDYLQSFKHQSKLILVGPLLLKQMDFSEPVVFVDGGSRLRQHKQGISVGDGDSSTESLDVQLNPNKDFSDLAYALNRIPEHFTEIHLHGFVGGRIDHQLFNFGEVHRFLNSRPLPTNLFFDDQIICYSAGTWTFTHYGIFSLACLDETTVQLSGEVEYPCLPEAKFSALSSLGLSNVANGEVELRCDKSIFILFSE